MRDRIVARTILSIGIGLAVMCLLSLLIVVASLIGKAAAGVILIGVVVAGAVWLWDWRTEK